MFIIFDVYLQKYAGSQYTKNKKTWINIVDKCVRSICENIWNRIIVIEVPCARIFLVRVELTK